MAKRICVVPALACVALLAACGDAGPPAMPFGTPQQLMANEVQPTAEIYWDSVRFESELVDGAVVERDIRPETDADWEKVRAAAARLGELGKALQEPGYAAERGEDWGVFAKGLVDVAAQAEAAAVAKDVDAVFEVGGTIYNVCTACHQMYPPATLPEGVSGEDLAPDDPA